jgi:hypothetical protein
VTLAPGDYRSFSSMGMNDRAVSVRPVGPGGEPAGPPGQHARIVLFDDFGMNGRSVALEGDVHNFDELRFNDRAKSAIVERGAWQLCEHAEFRGRCMTLEPGRYPNLEPYNDILSSARVMERGGPVPPPHQVRGAILFSQRGMQGRSVAIEREIVRNLDQIGFNDRASSVRIEQGYWLMCSDAEFEGECRTFGPGDYASLPPGLEGRISSVRRISPYYPYRENPSWR